MGKTYQDVMQAIRDGADTGDVEALIADERTAVTDAQAADLRAELATRDRVSELIAETRLLVGDDGSGTLGIIVRQALADDPESTAEDCAAIVREAIADAAAERERERGR